MSSDTAAQPVYTADHIRTIDAKRVRANPGMYVGNTGEAGLFRLLEYLLESSLSTTRDTIGITLHAGGSATVTYDRSGLPIGIDPKSARSQLEYDSSGIAVSALSEWCEVRTHTNGQHYRIEFYRGEVTKPLECLGSSDGRTGTTICFKPDPKIFGDITFDLGRILCRLCALAFLNRGARFTFTDERTGKTDQFQFPDGLAAYVKYLNTGRTTIHEPISFREAEGAIQVEVAMQFNADLESIEMGYMNDEFTRLGGTHLTGLRRALTTTLKRFGEEHGLFPATLNLKGEDFRDGLVAVVSVRHPNPEWEGATRSSVSNSELIGIVSRIVRRGIEDYLNRHPTAGKHLCEHVAKCARIRNAAEEAVHRVRAGSGSS
jgi:DNA gyrase subunit B